MLLDIEKVRAGIAAAWRDLSPAGSDAAMRAIMTTDPFPKGKAVAVETPAGTFRVGGIARAPA